MSRLTVRDLSVWLQGAPIVRNVSCAVGAGEIVGVIGPNGAGKSTLLRAACALIPAAAGAAVLDGQEITAMSPDARARAIAYLPQRHVLHWDLSLSQVVSLGRLPHVSGMDRLTPADRDAIGRAMEIAEITAFADRRVGTLSGGELARGMLARALAVEAPLLFADEPVAALDPYHALHIMELLRDLARSGRAVLVVLHDLTLALRFCDRLLLLQGGRLIAEGAPQDVLVPERLEAAYRVNAEYGVRAGEPYIVPWTRLPGGGLG
ncbi:MAG TPA: ABC transporter ATP-binding protein [Rhizomicrobium sp.]|nr:ABC transporter ATP-binding protein [Rhizomicrobium sp.]